MTIAAVSTSLAGSLAPSSTTQSAAPTATSSTPSGLNSSPAVINEVKMPAGSGVFGTTQADIQTAVNGINASIENLQRLDWSKLNLTPDQMATAKQWDMDRVLGAEGATIALAGESGLTDVSFDYEKVSPDATASAMPSSSAVTSPTSQSPTDAAVPPATTAAPTSPDATASAASIALTVLAGSADQAASAPAAGTQRRDFTV